MKHIPMEPPTLKAVLKETKKLLKSESILTTLTAHKFYYHYEGIGWLMGNNRIRNWRAVLKKWLIDDKIKLLKAEEPEPPGKVPADFFRKYTKEELAEIELMKQGYERITKSNE